jgi:hypothetical protein
LLFVVAIWFWAPLLKSWFAPDDFVPVAPSAPVGPNASTQPTAPGPANAAASPATPLTQPTGANPAGVPPAAAGSEQSQPFAGGYTWQQIAGAIDVDARMKPLAATSRTNVFPTPPPPEPVNLAPTEVVEEPPAVKLSPSEAGLVLTSTIVGPRRRTALINGRRYGVGDEVKSTKEGQQTVFKLLSVEPRQIVLENDGDRFLMKMPGGRLANDDSLE